MGKLSDLYLKHHLARLVAPLILKGAAQQFPFSSSFSPPYFSTPPTSPTFGAFGWMGASFLSPSLFSDEVCKSGEREEEWRGRILYFVRKALEKGPFNFSFSLLFFLNVNRPVIVTHITFNFASLPNEGSIFLNIFFCAVIVA